MRSADKNRDPERARKRARSDFRCAARKLGLPAALAALRELAPALHAQTRRGDCCECGCPAGAVFNSDSQGWGEWQRCDSCGLYPDDTLSLVAALLGAQGQPPEIRARHGD